jgi:hypothetical protein
MLTRVILRTPEGWNPSVMVDDDIGKVVRIDLGGVIYETSQSGVEYVRGLRPCYAVYVKYDHNYENSICNESNCPCVSTQYSFPVYLGTSCSYSVVSTSFDFVRTNGWEQWRSTGCFVGPGTDNCGNYFSNLDGVGGEVVISIPDEVLSNDSYWILVICFSEVEYVFSGVFETAIRVEPGNVGCEVSYAFIRSDGTTGRSGSTDSEAYIYAYAGNYYSQLRLVPSPGSNYEFEKFRYKWGIVGDGWEGGNWQDLEPTNNEYILQLSNVSTTSILFIKAYFKPKNVEVSTDFPIKQGMHLFGGWNLGYLEIINSNVEFHFSVSSFSNLPIGSALVPINGSRVQEILTPILVRQKYNLPKFGSIARLKDSSLIFYIPHPLKFKGAYNGGIYGTSFTDPPQRAIDTDYKLMDDSLISQINTTYGKYLMSMITFVVDDSTDSFASRSIEFSGCSIKVAYNSYSTDNTEWPHVSYFTLIRKFSGSTSSEQPFDYIIIPGMFRDNVLTGFFYEDDPNQPNSALFAAFTGFQLILNSSGTFFFDSSSSVTADILEDNYFVPKNKNLNAFINITGT